MSRRFNSVYGRFIYRKFREVSAHIIVKYKSDEGLDLDTIEKYNDALIAIVEELDDMLRRESVRGHDDPSILSPDVNNRSSTLRIVRRVGKQINALCVLADYISELGPDMNIDEARAVFRGEELLDRLFEMVMPEL